MALGRAFATVETIASRYAIQSGHLLELSAQQLISCDVGPELDGCSGGALELAFSSVEEVNTHNDSDLGIPTVMTSCHRRKLLL